MPTPPNRGGELRLKESLRKKTVQQHFSMTPLNSSPIFLMNFLHHFYLITFI